MGVFPELGLGGVWEPLTVAFLFVPSLYLSLAQGAHKEYGDALKAALEHEPARRRVQRRSQFEASVKGCLAMFQLDWWVVAAFAILVASILASGHFADALGRGLRASGQWSATDVKTVHVAMSVYATVISAAIALRFGWARLELSRRIAEFQADIPSYYMHKSGQ